MVAKYGMSDDIGPVVYSDESQEVFLGKDYSHVNNYSEATSARIDSEIERMMRNAYDLTKNILTTHNDKLVLVAETLLDKEKISREEFETLMKTGALPVDDEENAEETSADETEPKDEVSENISEEADAESEDNTVEASDDIVVEDTQKTEEEPVSKEEPTEEDNEESIENND